MKDVRTLLDEAGETVEQVTAPLAGAAEVGGQLAAQGIRATEALVDAVAQLVRSLPETLQKAQLPPVKRNLEQVADQLVAIAARFRTIRGQLGAASVPLCDPTLQASGRLIVDGLQALASITGMLRPGDAGLIRFVPGPLARPYLDAIGRVEQGVAAAATLVRMCVNALPAIGGTLRDVGDDLGGAAELLEGTARAIRDLAGFVPQLDLAPPR